MLRSVGSHFAWGLIDLGDFDVSCGLAVAGASAEMPWVLSERAGYACGCVCDVGCCNSRGLFLTPRGAAAY